MPSDLGFRVGALRRVRALLRERSRVHGAGYDAVERWRAGRLAAMRAHAVTASPFYRDLHAGRGDAPLGELPVVTKSDLVANFDAVVTDRSLRLDDLRAFVTAAQPGSLLRGRYRVAVSSGSTGRPGVLAYDVDEWSALLAASAQAAALARSPGSPGPKRSFRRVRAARIGSPSGWHMSAQLGATLRDPRTPSLRLGADLPVDVLARRLASWRPDVLSGYPSVLRALAHEQSAGRFAIAPARVLTTGELLTRSTRRVLAGAWGTEPFDHYVTTETGMLAVECGAHGGLHVLGDHVVVEVVDDDGHAVEPGEWGTRVLVSVPSSRTVPLIRYELADAVRVRAGECPCGRAGLVLAEIGGRAREAVMLRGDRGDVAVHPVVFSAVLDPLPVAGWRVVVRPDGLDVLLARPAPGFDVDAVAPVVAQAVVAAGASAPAVNVEVVDELSRAAGGKAARVVTAVRDVSSTESGSRPEPR